MFGKQYTKYLVDRSASTETSRRSMLTAMGLTGAGAVGAGMFLGSGSASAAPASANVAASPDASAPANDVDILNFALNLEYLEAQYYLMAYSGFGLQANQADAGANAPAGGAGRGHVVGGRKVPFKTARVKQYAYEISRDENAHVNFLRAALGESRVAFPQIDLTNSFNAAAAAAGLGSSFDPFANELNFLVGAFIFEDVGVTAYKGAANAIVNKTYLEAAAGILAAEAYHAATVRTLLLEAGLQDVVAKISNARDSLDGTTDLDQGIVNGTGANITPLDTNGIAFSRSTSQVLNIVYLNGGSGVTKGGFFPNGLNGTVNNTA